MEEQYEYISFIDNLNDCEFSEIDCPDCKIYKLKIYPEGTSPDDYTNKLICANCFYEESE